VWREHLQTHLFRKHQNQPEETEMSPQSKGFLSRLLSERFFVAGLAITLWLLLAPARAEDFPPGGWPPVTLPVPREVTLSGPLGQSLARGLARLTKPPFSEQWLRADVSFEIGRIYTSYSGDVSGRFLELGTLTSTPGRPQPATLPALLKTVARYQKVDGHFGVEIDLKKPLLKPLILMLWGNARLLVGLVTAAEQFRDAELLASARRLGDFYVSSAGQLCAPEREAEYRASGTDGESYTCCYFPAIEGLAMLYRATHDGRYLKQARRMAEFFRKFDALPIDHSHGNLCAWRGILLLYDITGQRAYLDRARAKWDAAMQGGFIWPVGGVGEHWYVSFNIDEGCSESDWLRLSLDLWRYTGETRYLDIAERLLVNQYTANQCPNGGYGTRHFDFDAAGPIAICGWFAEAPFCCDFHGPLGLHFLKSYLAAGSSRGVLVNFPFDFTAPVHAGGRDWLVKVRTQADFLQGRSTVEIELAPQGNAASATTTLWLRMPPWAVAAKATVGQSALSAPVERGYLRIDREFKTGEKVVVVLHNRLTLEGRRFQTVRPAAGGLSRLHDVAVLAGPYVLFAPGARLAGRPTLLATIDGAGRLRFPANAAGGYATVALPGLNVDEAGIAQAIHSARPVFLRPLCGTVSADAFESILSLTDLGRLPSDRAERADFIVDLAAAFMVDLVVVPADSVARQLAGFEVRAKEAASRAAK
jgi:hypothetical protein